MSDKFFTKLEKLSFSYSFKDQKVPIFEEIDFEIPCGTTVIMGPSGCGKSTLLKLIAKLLIPNSGALVNQNSHSTFYSPQDKVLFPWLSVRQNIELPLTIGKYRVGEGKRGLIVESVERTLNITSWTDRYPFQLSGGMRSRVAVAQAIATQATSILFDEPFVGLDEVNADMLAYEFSGIFREDLHNVLLVSHTPRHAALLADSVIFITATPNKSPTILEFSESNVEIDSIEHQDREKSIREKLVSLHV